MASEGNIIAQSIGSLIFLLVYSAHAVQDNSETEGIFGIFCTELQKKKNEL